MLARALWKNAFIRPFAYQELLNGSNSSLLRTISSCLTNHHSTSIVNRNNVQPKLVETIISLKPRFENIPILSESLSSKGDAKDKILDYLSSKSIWDDDPKCDRTPYCESKHRPQRMDELEEKLKGPKKYKKLANYFPELRKRNQINDPYHNSKKKFSTSAAFFVDTRYKIPGTRRRRRGAPLSAEELITIRDNKFYSIRKQLEGVYSEHENEKPKRRKCPAIRGRMKNCCQRYREDCGVVGKPFHCEKVECPYPCYVDCKELDPEPPFSECLLCPVERATIRAKYLARKCDL